MSYICKWRVRCTTDNKYVYDWSATKPTACPENGGHSIDSTATVIVQTRKGLNVIVDPSMEAVLPGASLGVANGRPVVEIQAGDTGWGATLSRWPHDGLSVAILRVTLKVILKATGTGTVIRLAARAKADGAGDDSSAAWADTQYLDKTITHTTLGEVFEGTFDLDASNFNLDDALALQVGRDGAHANDTLDQAIQIMGVKAVAH
jgi:hypothetical protein